MPAKPTKIKDRIWKYMEDKDITYREMAKVLDVEPHQRLYQWLTNENESFSSKVERKFNELVDVDELS